MAGPATQVTALGPTLYGPRGDALIAKATSDFGAMGNAMSDAAIASSLYNQYRAWQQNHLRDAAIHWWLYKINPWVRTCVDLIVQRATADAYSVASDSDDEQGIKALQTFLASINPRQSFDRLLRGVYRDMQVNGNWYGRVQFQGKLAVAIYRVDFRTIVPKPVKVGAPEAYHLYRNGRVDYSPEEIPAEEIIQITLNDAGENWCGLSPLESLDATLANDQAAITYNTSFFSNGAKAGDIYEMAPDMGPDAVEREREYLKQNFTKPSQSFEPLFLQGGVKLLRDGAALRKDMEFVQLRMWNREEVCAVFSTPISLVTGQVGALGANGKEQDNILFKEAMISPLQKQVFEDWDRELLQKRMGQTDLHLIAPKVTKVRLEVVQMAEEMTKSGATGNEARRVMGLEDMDGMDLPLYLAGRQTSLVGIPGNEDSVLLTQHGAMSARVQDPADVNGTAAAAAPPAGASDPSEGAAVTKAEDDDADENDVPEWVKDEVRKTAARLTENAAAKQRQLARTLGANV